MKLREGPLAALVTSANQYEVRHELLAAEHQLLHPAGPSPLLVPHHGPGHQLGTGEQMILSLDGFTTLHQQLPIDTCQLCVYISYKY